VTWRGANVEVTELDNGRKVWSFWACVRCGHELFDGQSIARGLGPDCVRKVSEWRAEQLRHNARAIDRAAYREHLAAENRWKQLEGARAAQVIGPEGLGAGYARRAP
jgi:hypothetical protein